MNSKASVAAFLCLLSIVFFVFRSIETGDPPLSQDEVSLNSDSEKLAAGDQTSADPDFQTTSLNPQNFKTINPNSDPIVSQASPMVERIQIDTQSHLRDSTPSSNDTQLEQLLTLDQTNPQLVGTRNARESTRQQSQFPKTSNNHPIETLETNLNGAKSPVVSQSPVLRPAQSSKTESPIQIAEREPGNRASISPSVRQKIQQHLSYGHALAKKGSTYSATSEFMQGLKLISQYWDQHAGTTEYSRALERGFVALKEAEDFVVKESDARHFTNPKTLIKAHRSKVISAEKSKDLPAIDVLRRYMKFSQTNLIDGCGGTLLASELYYALGKLHLTLSNFNRDREVNKIRAIVLFRTALAANPKNGLAANELAVILVQNGHWETAKRLLTSSLRESPTPVAWKNLAQIHNNLNEPELAQFAMEEFQRISQTPTQQRNVQWVSPEYFRQSQPEFYQQQMASQGRAMNQTQGPPQTGRGYQAPQKTANKPRLIDRVKGLFR